MTSARIFITAWLGVSVPLAMAEVGAIAYLRWYSGARLGDDGPLLLYRSLFAIGAAALQALVLSLHRRPVPSWPGWTVAGHVAAAVGFLGLQHHFEEYRGQFGAVKLPA